LRVIKNSEEIEKDNLKYESYCKALNASILYAILHKAIFQIFLTNTKNISKEKLKNFELMNTHLPLLHEMFLFENIGTLKLSSVIREKINNDKRSQVSEFERAMSVFLYSDIRAKDSNNEIAELIKNVKTGYIDDLIFFKLVTYYFYRSKDDATDNFYLNLIAEVLIKSKGYSKLRKSSLMDEYRKKKQTKFLRSNND
jgi:hypothetical protein